MTPSPILDLDELQAASDEFTRAWGPSQDLMSVGMVAIHLRLCLTEGRVEDLPGNGDDYQLCGSRTDITILLDPKLEAQALAMERAARRVRRALRKRLEAWDQTKTPSALK